VPSFRIKTHHLRVGQNSLIETCEVFVSENDDGMKVTEFNKTRSKLHDIFT